MDDRLQAAIAIVRAEYPRRGFFRSASRRRGNLSCPQVRWNEYKRLIGAVKDEVTANEILVQKFLSHRSSLTSRSILEMDPARS
jgi:hypothetical protein